MTECNKSTLTSDVNIVLYKGLLETKEGVLNWPVMGATILLFLSLPYLSKSVEIVSTSPSFQTVRQGEELDLFCESSSPYQWCYWAHNSSEFPTTSHKGGGEVREETVWGFQWRKSSTRCGLHVSSVDVDMGGRWKCHLADTDSKDLETIRWGEEIWFLRESFSELRKRFMSSI